METSPGPDHGERTGGGRQPLKRLGNLHDQGLEMSPSSSLLGADGEVNGGVVVEEGWE